MTRICVRPILIALLMGALAASPALANIVHEICGLVPGSVHSYAGMCAKLQALDQTPRVSLMSIGKSASGRTIPCVAVHDPRSVFGQTRCLFIIGRQHGNEVSGTEACMALIQHFATAKGQVETETLKRLTLVFVPMMNPDGAEKGRRRNDRGVDLNRDWRALSQPETIAIEKAVRAWQPAALIDLHELPRSSSKAAYRENFVETIGDGAGIPTFVSSNTLGASSTMLSWFHDYGHAANIYFDGPGKDRRLCHRHFGLDRGIPSFLFEAKTGGGRSLKQRVSFHVLGSLVVANYLLQGSKPPPQSFASTTPAAVGAAAMVALHLQEVADPEGEPAPGLLAQVHPDATVRYVKFYLNGRLWFVSNTAPYECPFAPEEWASRPHEVRVDVIGADGKVLAQAQRRVDMQDRALGR